MNFKVEDYIKIRDTNSDFDGMIGVVKDVICDGLVTMLTVTLVNEARIGDTNEIALSVENLTKIG